MSDSSKLIDECPHGRFPDRCVTCLNEQIVELQAAILREREEWNQFCGIRHPEGSSPLAPKDARLLKAIFTPIDDED